MATSGTEHGLGRTARLVFAWLTVWWDGRPWSDMLVRGLSAWVGWIVVLTVSDWRRERRSAKRTPQKTD
ncbi:hypothetical protein [Streptomyces chrestomyceticus]|uniref:hypothetical protein n=1 Tax=Streptomyces chrestomyceticus TaxID=68185 RepID=UPI00340E8797